MGLISRCCGGSLPHHKFKPDWLQPYLKPGDCIIDVGCGDADYFDKYREMIGDSGRIIGVDPVPYPKLMEGMGRDFDWIQCVLGDHAEEAVTIWEKRQGTSRFHEACPDGERRLIPMKTLDGIWPDRPVAVLKIDAQGGEVDILKCSEKVGTVPMAVVEAWPHGLKQAGTCAVSLLSLLHSRHFSVYRYPKGTAEEVTLEFAREWDERQRSPVYEDWLCLK